MPTAVQSSITASLLRAALCTIFCLIFVVPTSADSSARSPAGDEEVVLKLAGDEILCNTITTPFARNHLERSGAGGIKVEGVTAPWTLRVSGRLPNGKVISVLVRCSSTEDGLKRLAEGKVDIALAAREATPEEIQAFPALGNTDGTSAFASIARTAIVIAVNPSNSVTMLSFEQLREIYTGKLKDWAELGGEAGKIRPLAIQPGSATQELFQNIVIGAPPPEGTVQSVASFEDLRAALLNDPGAIGYLAVPNGLKQLNIEIGKNHIISPPSNYRLASGDYPLAQSLYLYRNPETHNPDVFTFFRTAQSVRSEFTILSAGLSILSPQLLVPEFPPSVPAVYADLATRGLRVSTTIRFAAGSTKIDTVASHNLDLLARYLRFLQVRGDQIVLAAFSDDSGSTATDYAVSDQLAKIVSAELERRLVTTGNVISAGSSYQLSSNFTPAGRAINRRVEIWLRP